MVILQTTALDRLAIPPDKPAKETLDVKKFAAAAGSDKFSFASTISIGDGSILAFGAVVSSPP